MFLPRHTVTSGFRIDLVQLLPGLGNSDAYWRLMGLILFGGVKQEEATGHLRMGREFVANLLGDADRQLARWRRGEGSALTFLEAFSRDVIPLEIGDYSYKKERTVLPCVPPEVYALACSERRVVCSNRVWMDTGKPFTADAQKAWRRTRREDGLAALAEAHDHSSQHLIRYLNEELPSNSFSKLVEFFESAHRLVDALGVGEAALEHQHNVLKAMQDDAKPYYQVSTDGLSVRVWPRDINMLMLKSEVRHLITSQAGWSDADLQSAQLAIVSAPPPAGWDVAEVRHFLHSGNSIWDYLAEGLGVEVSTWKPFLKKRLYGVCYGEGDGGRRRAFAEEAPYGIRAGARKFAAIPLVAAIISARHEAIQKVKREIGAIDAFGSWLPLERRGISDRGVYGEQTNVLSILALVAQSWELKLLEPVIDLARSEGGRDSVHGFSIMLWQHDGFCVRASSVKDARRWANRLTAAVDERCKEFGVPTKLVWQDHL